MPLLVSVQQAAANSLAKYLKEEVDNVEVEPRWPDPDKKLPVRAITVIPAGPRRLIWMDQPQLVSKEELDENKIMCTWRLAECEQPYQIDIWSQFDLDRDDIIARLDTELNRGFSNLLFPNHSPTVEQCLALELSDGWEGSIAYFMFDDVQYTDTPDQVTRTEYRATYSGMGYFNLLGKSEVAKIAQINLKLKLYESDPDSVNTSTYAVTDSDVTYSEDP